MEGNKTGYPRTLKYFMWKWQVHFGISAQVTAESLFKLIDRGLTPKIFFIGFSQSAGDNPIVCYEPEEMEFFQLDVKLLVKTATKLEKKDPDRNMIYTGEGVNEAKANQRWEKNFRNALIGMLDNKVSLDNKVHFASQGFSRNGYMVYLIIQFDRTVYNSHVHMSYINPEIRATRHLSLIDSVIDAYLTDQHYKLYMPEAGYDRGVESDSKELLRRAAKVFFYTIGYQGYNLGFHHLQSICDQVSTTPYEGKTLRGHLLVARKDHPGITMTMRVRTPFPAKDYRKLRKELQLSNHKIAVICDSELVYGLGYENDAYDSSKEDLFHIRFEDLFCYNIFHKEKMLMRIKFGLPEYTEEQINLAKFVSLAKRLFRTIVDEQIAVIYQAAKDVAASGSGAMLIIAQDAESESARLGKQCISIVPTKVETEMVQSLCSIDGGILIGIDGIVYAKGVILDGIVGNWGDASRGSRYNSALTYSEYRSWDKPTLIVVVSEDGMVDLLPTLMPQIKHSEILRLIETLRSLNSPETFVAKTFYQIMEMLNARRFYFTETECDEINKLKRELSVLDRTLKVNLMWQDFADFFPNEGMSKHYYQDEF